MGQQEVYDFLLKHPDQWYTSKQISEQLVVSIGSVTMSLKKLRKTNIIKFRNTGKRNTFQYMVQSEPAKLAERKMPIIEAHAQIETQVKKVKIKPKVVHQHSYLGGQTFYGVIRGKDEANSFDRNDGPVTGSTFSDSDDEKEIEVTISAPVKRTVRRAVKAKKATKKKVKRVAVKKKAKKAVRVGTKKKASKKLVRKSTPKKALKRKR